jgi:hypothetical protein
MELYHNLVQIILAIKIVTIKWLQVTIEMNTNLTIPQIFTRAKGPLAASAHEDDTA